MGFDLYTIVTTFCSFLHIMQQFLLMWISKNLHVSFDVLSLSLILRESILFQSNFLNTFHLVTFLELIFHILEIIDKTQYQVPQVISITTFLFYMHIKDLLVECLTLENTIMYVQAY